MYLVQTDVLQKKNILRRIFVPGCTTETLFTKNVVWAPHWLEQCEALFLSTPPQELYSKTKIKEL